MTTQNFLPHERRVVDELKENDIRIAKLDAFMKSEMWITVNEAEKERLVRQLAIMREYSAVLNERIAAFK